MNEEVIKKLALALSKEEARAILREYFTDFENRELGDDAIKNAPDVGMLDSDYAEIRWLIDYFWQPEVQSEAFQILNELWKDPNRMYSLDEAFRIVDSNS